MSVQASVNRPLGGQLRVGALGIALIAAAGFITGLGLAIGARLTPVAKPVIALQVPAFDAAQFRLQEKASLSGHAFDAAQFRLQEKASVQVPAFNAPAFRLEEKASLSGPAFDAAQFRLQEKGS